MASQLSEPGHLVLGGARFALDMLADRAVGQVHQPELLVKPGVAGQLRLCSVRFLFTAETAREGTNDATARDYVAQPRRTERSWSPQRWGGGRPIPDLALKVPREELLPLYQHYLADRIRRLDAYRKRELIDAFHS